MKRLISLASLSMERSLVYRSSVLGGGKVTIIGVWIVRRMVNHLTLLVCRLLTDGSDLVSLCYGIPETSAPSRSIISPFFPPLFF